MNILLYGSENWLLNGSDKRCLNAFWKDACRMAVGTTRQRAYMSGYALVDIRKKLEVEAGRDGSCRGAMRFEICLPTR